MNRRREIAMSAEEQRAFLANARTLVLSSIAPRGYPHSVATWFSVFDGVVHMTTFRKAQKVLNPSANEELRRRTPKRVAIRVRSERVASWDHSKLGGTY